MAHPEIPLITLTDGNAPYKGTWCLVRHGSFEAVHTTYHPEHAPGCEIERLSFAGADPARQFVRHLLLHNWHVHNVHSAGEAFWVGLPG